VTLTFAVNTSPGEHPFLAGDAGTSEIARIICRAHTTNAIRLLCCGAVLSKDNKHASMLEITQKRIQKRECLCCRFCIIKLLAKRAVVKI